MNNIYLACPYTHAHPKIRSYRAEVATSVAGYLISNGYFVYSPITHGHAIVSSSPSTATDWEFWSGHCSSFLHKWAESIFVVCIDGWSSSIGVQKEIELALSLKLPVFFYDHILNKASKIAPPKEV